MTPRRVGHYVKRTITLRNPVILLLSIALWGCQATPSSQQVLVPVPIRAPEPGLVAPPYLPILDVPRGTIESCENTGDLCGDIVKALDASLEAAMSWGRQLEITLDGYRQQE